MISCWEHIHQLQTFFRENVLNQPDSLPEVTSSFVTFTIQPFCEKSHSVATSQPLNNTSFHSSKVSVTSEFLPVGHITLNKEAAALSKLGIQLCLTLVTSGLVQIDNSHLEDKALGFNPRGARCTSLTCVFAEVTAVVSHLWFDKWNKEQHGDGLSDTFRQCESCSQANLHMFQMHLTLLVLKSTAVKANEKWKQPVLEPGNRMKTAVLTLAELCRRDWTTALPMP